MIKLIMGVMTMSAKDRDEELFQPSAGKCAKKTRTLPEIYTIGHSTLGLDEFMRLLRDFGIQRVVDVRTIPRSRHNPQFNREALSHALHNRRLHYRHMKTLGGWRYAHVNSPNTGWKNDSFRGYADYMQTPAFTHALEKLIKLAAAEPSVIMCAEAVPWRCHRSLIADALSIHGVPVRHIHGPAKATPHVITPFARVTGEQITYPQ